jgi:RNA polymerase sigma-70 factor (ECF subfamily)
MTDAELVALARSGDEEAFGRLIARHHRDCLRYAHWMLGDAHQAEDAVQETLLRVVRALPRYREEQQFRAWLFQILVNRCRSLRHRWLRWAGRHGDLAEAERIATRSPVDPVEVEAITSALGTLSAPLREAFVLKHGEEFSYDEMAELTGASVPALKMRVKRACDHLRLELERTNDRTS